MESNRANATKALLSRFTYYSQSQITEIIRLLDLAGAVDPLQSGSSWSEERVHQILKLFKDYFSYKNPRITSKEIAADFEPSDQSTDLLLNLAILEYNMANNKRNLGDNVLASHAIRAKAKIPKVLSFKGYVLNQYECEGDYARYTDYLFFGYGSLKEEPSANRVIFFRATKNQVRDFFDINKKPEVGSYIDFINRGGEISVNEEAFLDFTDNFDGRSIPISATWGGWK